MTDHTIDPRAVIASRPGYRRRRRAPRVRRGLGGSGRHRHLQRRDDGKALPDGAQRARAIRHDDRRRCHARHQCGIDGQVSIGSYLKIETNCYIPTRTTIGSRVFFGPNVVLTNDRYPLKMRDGPARCIIEDLVTLGGGCTICPGVTIGRASSVAAGALVTRDVPADHLALGHPARVRALPDHLREDNMALSWRDRLERS